MLVPITALTSLTSKDVQHLQPHRSRQWCDKQLRLARETAGSAVALVKHLAAFWAVDDADIITQLRSRFTV